MNGKWKSLDFRKEFCNFKILSIDKSLGVEYEYWKLF